ncbi:MAG: DNA polymerase III subunit delta' [Hyphomicrobiaceae bacterium]
MARAPIAPEIETLPEADRLEDFPHPRHTAALFGHDAAERALTHGVAQGRMHHGWLIAGPEGVGKATLAWRLARHLLARPGERDAFGESLEVPPETTAARQVAALSHPDLLLLRRVWDTRTKRFTTGIPVDEVRRLRSFLTHTSAHDANRVVIVDSADELNTAAANALLKSLEEPPANTFFLLVTSAPGRLLPTIRSRCRMLELHALGTQDLKLAALKALEGTDIEPPGPSEWVHLTAIADGSVRRLLMLWGLKGLDLQERIEALLGASRKLDWPKVHALGDELASPASAARFELFFDLLLRQIALMTRARATGETEAGPGRLAQRLIADAALASWAELWETIAREKGETQALNLDRKSLILETFRRIETVARA